MFIPNDIYSLIIQFSTGFKITTNIFCDLDRICDIRKYVPSMLFNKYVPCTDYFPLDFTAKHIYFNLFKANPYKIGSPYIPTNCVCENNIINTDIILHLISLLKVECLKDVSTRRFHMIKSAIDVEHHIVHATYHILHFGKLFFLLSNPDNFSCDNHLDYLLVSKLSAQVFALRSLHLTNRFQNFLFLFWPRFRCKLHCFATCDGFLFTLIFPFHFFICFIYVFRPMFSHLY